jgi:hypothetical protein
MSSRWRWAGGIAGSVVLVAIAAAVALGEADSWQWDKDLQRNGSRAVVAVVGIDHDDPRDPKVLLHMPDGTVGRIEAGSGLRVGDSVEIVYWDDDQAAPELLGWPTSDAVTGLVVAIPARTRPGRGGRRSGAALPTAAVRPESELRGRVDDRVRRRRQHAAAGLAERQVRDRVDCSGLRTLLTARGGG